MAESNRSQDDRTRAASIDYQAVQYRRLDDRIRELCAKAVVASDSELESTLAQLQAAIHEHTERLRKLAVEKLNPILPASPDKHQ